MKPSLPIIGNIKIMTFNVRHICAFRILISHQSRAVTSPTHPCRTPQRLNYWWRLALCAALLATVTINTQATSVVAYKTATDIFVGADSLAGGDNANRPVLKLINITNRFFVSGSGNVRLPGFEIWTEAERCSGLTTSSIESCTERIRQDLPFAIERYRVAHPDEYQREIAGKIGFLDVMFFGEMDGSLSLFIRAFGLSQSVVPSLTIKGLPLVKIVKSTDCPASCSGFFALGVNDEIGRILDGNSAAYFRGRDEPLAICELINKEIDIHPDLVGWPVNVLRLTSDGAQEWHKYESKCEEKKDGIATPKATQPTSPQRKPPHPRKRL